MLIAVDLDEVLADTLSLFIEFHNKKYNSNLSWDDFNTFDWWEVIGEEKEKTVDKVMEFFLGGYGKMIKPLKGAIENIPFINNNNDLVILTARPRIYDEITFWWVDKYYPKIFSKIYFSDASLYNSPAQSKGEICQKINAGLLIEDDYNFAKEASDMGVKVLLFNKPWNKDEETPSGMKRVYTWENIVEKIVD